MAACRNGFILLVNGFSPRARSDGTVQCPARFCRRSSSYFRRRGRLQWRSGQDLAVANFDSSTISVLLGNGDGTFRAAPTVAAGPNPFAVVVGDFNGDGKLDLAVADHGSNTVLVLLGNGDGTFGA